MSQFYKLLKADPLGDPWTPNFPDAKPIQNWWCQVEGEEWPVSIGKQVGASLTPGQHVYGDLLKAKSQKGTDFWKFKSAKVPEGVPVPADTPAQAVAQQATGQNISEQAPAWFTPFANQMSAIEKMVKDLHGGYETDAVPVVEEHVKTDAEIAQDEADQAAANAALDTETQATLDEIFPDNEPADYPDDIGAKG